MADGSDLHEIANILRLYYDSWDRCTEEQREYYIQWAPTVFGALSEIAPPPPSFTNTNAPQTTITPPSVTQSQPSAIPNDFNHLQAPPGFTQEEQNWNVINSLSNFGGPPQLTTTIDSDPQTIPNSHGTGVPNAQPLTPGAFYGLTAYITTLGVDRQEYDNSRALIQLLNQFGIPFTEVDLSTGVIPRRAIAEASRVWQLPQLFFGNVFVGSFEEIIKWNEQGVLFEALRQRGYSPEGSATPISFSGPVPTSISATNPLKEHTYRLTIVEAKLSPVNNTKAECFAQVITKNVKQATKIDNNRANPVWKESIELTVNSDDLLVVSVLDNEVSKEQPVGSISFKIPGVEANGTDFWMPLVDINSVQIGEIHLTIDCLSINDASSAVAPYQFDVQGAVPPSVNSQYQSQLASAYAQTTQHQQQINNYTQSSATQYAAGTYTQTPPSGTYTQTPLSLHGIATQTSVPHSNVPTYTQASFGHTAATYTQTADPYLRLYGATPLRTAGANGVVLPGSPIASVVNPLINAPTYTQPIISGAISPTFSNALVPLSSGPTYSHWDDPHAYPGFGPSVFPVGRRLGWSGALTNCPVCHSASVTRPPLEYPVDYPTYPFPQASSIIRNAGVVYGPPHVAEVRRYRVPARYPPTYHYPDIYNSSYYSPSFGSSSYIAPSYVAPTYTSPTTYNSFGSSYPFRRRPISRRRRYVPASDYYEY